MRKAKRIEPDKLDRIVFSRIHVSLEDPLNGRKAQLRELEDEYRQMLRTVSCEGPEIISLAKDARLKKRRNEPLNQWEGDILKCYDLLRRIQSIREKMEAELEYIAEKAV